MRVSVAMRVLPALMLMQGIGAFIQCFPNGMASHGIMKSAPPGGSKLRTTPPLRTKPCRMAVVGEEEAIKSIKAWEGAPKDARLVCAPSPSDAGVMAKFLSEANGGAGAGLLITPNCESAGKQGDMGRMAEYLNSILPWADVKAVEGAPHSCLSFTSRQGDASDFKEGGDTTNEEVMGKVLDWFTNLLITLDDEELYIDIGRSLLGVQHYAVCRATTLNGITGQFWGEVASSVEGRQEGNILMVMPEFSYSTSAEFQDYVAKQLAVPLEWATASAKKLVVTSYHPTGVKIQSPWPIIQIAIYDPAPPRNPGDLGPEDEGDYLDAEMETTRVTADELRDAKAAKGQQVPMPPPIPSSMPGFPLNLDELTEEAAAEKKDA
eukprot:CAMPEP_0174921406 /NCGR_PEP_ID=MMETSP1355-20121228/5138_1 /TAXON_ID=464990 /ORGANISM="Hemiselmis tepida, Strain CCMP443" /LENGTH=377 /DNA_ID=CAMNT_0016166889 /DNA_START=53 /DNA_END=1183 /DNA_ORIENTATION=-